MADYPHQWKTDFRALEPGNNKFYMWETVAPSLAIRLGSFCGAAIQKGEVPEGARTYSILMNDVDGHYFRGLGVRRYDLMTFGGNREVDTSSGSASTVCTISIEQEYLEQTAANLGVDLDLDSSQVIPLSGQRRLQLESSINVLAELEGSHAEQLLEQDNLVDLILDSLTQDSSPGRFPKNSYRTVRRALGYIEQNLSRPLRISEINCELGISTRTLQLNFQKYLGASPKRVIEQMRLSTLRRRIMVEADTHSTVSRFASEQGYSHLSQLAQDYFKTFGELPSDTLRQLLGRQAGRRE